MIEFRDLTKYYGSLAPIRRLQLRIDDGEFVSVVGPSGSGKTTLLNLAAGLLKPSTGEVIIDNHSLYEMPPRVRAAFRRENFGFVFQTFNLIPYLTALENVEVSLYLAGMARNSQEDKALSLLQRVGLADRCDHFPSQMSIGEQQRVAVARALANSPKVIFADEPTGNLDRANSAEVIDHLSDLNRSGVTIVLVTHDTELAESTQRIIELN